MDGAVAAEKQDRVGLIGSCGHADAPGVFGRLGILKGLEVVGGTSQAEDGGGAHVPEGSRNRNGDTETRRKLFSVLLSAKHNVERVPARVGILRLRRAIREASRSAALRMTGYRLITAEGGCPPMGTDEGSL